MSESLDRLTDRLGQETAVVVAYSGGVDSSLLAVVAHQVLGPKAVAVTAVSASLPERERVDARELALAQGFAHVEVCTDELLRSEYRRNDGNRCAHCKSALFDQLEPLAGLLDARIALAANLDDLGDYRPGQAVARSRDAIFPLVDAGLSKADVRAVSRELGLSTHDKPAAACLSSRVAYGDSITAELLERIERAENALHDKGYSHCRVRAHANGTVARIEVPPDRLAEAVADREAIAATVRDCGFAFCTLDLDGFRSGSMNALLQLGPVRST